MHIYLLMNVQKELREPSIQLTREPVHSVCVVNRAADMRDTHTDVYMSVGALCGCGGKAISVHTRECAQLSVCGQQLPPNSMYLFASRSTRVTNTKTCITFY